MFSRCEALWHSSLEHRPFAPRRPLLGVGSSVFLQHGTCVSTLDPDCYSSYQSQEEVVDYFEKTVELVSLNRLGHIRPFLPAFCPPFDLILHT